MGQFGRVLGSKTKEAFYGYPVNCWSIKRTPNGTKLDRRSTGDIPRLLGKPRSISIMFNAAHNKRQKGTSVDIGVSDCKMDNRENAQMHETNTYAK